MEQLLPQVPGATPTDFAACQQQLVNPSVNQIEACMRQLVAGRQPAQDPGVVIEQPQPRPIYKRWWFWVAVAGTLTVGVTTVVVVVRRRLH